MKDKDIEEVVNTFQKKYAGDQARLFLSIGVLVKDCVKLKQDREKRGKQFDTQIFIDEYNYEILFKEVNNVIFNIDKYYDIETKIGNLQKHNAEIKNNLDILYDNSLRSSRFFSRFFRDYVVGILVTLTFPIVLLVILSVVALSFGVDFSPKSIAMWLGGWLTKIGA